MNLIEIIRAALVAVPTGIVGVALWMGFCLALTRITRSQAEKIALAQFRLDYPNFRRCFTLKQRDGELDIAMIAYGSTRPPTRIYYVNRTKKPGSPRSRGRFQISF